MTIEAFYQTMGVNSEGILARFATEERVKKYLGKMLDDKTFANLAKAMEQADYEQAFFAVHTLKGIAANLDLLPLYQACGQLTEMLREQKQPDEAQVNAVYKQVQAAYENVMTLIPEVL